MHIFVKYIYLSKNIYLYVFVKTHQIMHLKLPTFIVYKLHYNKNTHPLKPNDELLWMLKMEGINGYNSCLQK